MSATLGYSGSLMECTIRFWKVNDVTSSLIGASLELNELSLKEDNFTVISEQEWCAMTKNSKIPLIYDSHR